MASWIYDLLVSVSIYMVVGLILSAIVNTLFQMGHINTLGYENGSSYTMNSLPFKIILNGLSIICISYFFVYFWSRSGQTIGMKAWRLRVQNLDGSLISKKTGLKRLLPTLIGFGNFAVLFDRKNKLSLQDRLTQTEVVVLPIEVSRAKNR
jgi:uncharacterized RDD family membrane protein YckC